MSHRASIERDAASGTDPGGQPLPPDFRPHLDDVPCRCWVEPRQEISANGERTVVIEARRMIVPLGTDVREGDRVARVFDRLGRELFPGPARVESVSRRADHLLAILEELS